MTQAARENAEQAEDELWGLAFKRLLVWTMKRHHMNRADAEDTVQEGIRLFLRAGGTVNPADPKQLVNDIGSRINGIAIDRRRKKADGAVCLTTDGAPAEPDEGSDPEGRTADDDAARKAITAVLQRVEDDEVATGVILQSLEGADDAEAQAKALKRSVVEIYKARRRLKGHWDAVKKLMESD